LLNTNGEIPAPKKLSLEPPSTVAVYNCFSGSVCVCVWCSLSAEGSTEEAVLALQEELHEKEMRLTDVQLEALSSAHQLQQLQDTVNRMKVTNHVPLPLLFCFAKLVLFQCHICTE